MMTKAKAVGHYVNSILAAREARRGGYDEALMLDTDGFVSEASGENIFIIRDGVVKTPPLTSVLPGITRDTIMTLLRERGYTLVEDRFTRDEAYIADEAFFTGTAAEVTPIRELDDRAIGSARPGPRPCRRPTSAWSVVVIRRTASGFRTSESRCPFSCGSARIFPARAFGIRVASSRGLARDCVRASPGAGFAARFAIAKHPLVP
jgi:hypothetical protein